MTKRSYDEGYCNLEITGVSKSRVSTTCFLIGVDEKKHFISVLKKIVSSVEEAHEELRPDGISDKAVRHGEWFFDPVPPRKAQEVLSQCFFKRRRLEEDSSHESSVGYHDGKKYAFGRVSDTRKDYHKPIVLTTLHRVVRNNERNLIYVRNYD